MRLGNVHILCQQPRGGEGGVENLTYADMKFREGGVRQLVMSANAKNENHDFLNCHENIDQNLVLSPGKGIS